MIKECFSYTFLYNYVSLSGVNITINETRGGLEPFNETTSKLTKQYNITRNGTNATKIDFHSLDYLMDYEDLLSSKGNEIFLLVFAPVDFLNFWTKLFFCLAYSR